MSWWKKFAKKALGSNLGASSADEKAGCDHSDIQLRQGSGGNDPLTSHGHRKSDALRIQTLIESYQANMAKEPAPCEQR